MDLPIILKDEELKHIEIINYPDGQKSIKLDMNYFNHKYSYVISCRIKSFNDLELLFCIIAALEKHDLIITKINFYYLFGLRSDRAFEIGQPNYARDVLLPILNTIKYPWYIFYPHNNRLFNDEIELDEKYRTKIMEGKLIIGADESASYRFGTQYNFIKKRDHLGNINLYIPKELKKELHNFHQTILIIDDLCDGGATFIEIGKLLEEFHNRKELLVIHGLFTKGLDELTKYYDHIYTTNSYQDFITTPHNMEIIKVI